MMTFLECALIAALRCLQHMVVQADIDVHALYTVLSCPELAVVQADFDVRWCRGPVAERLFKPMLAHLQSMGGHILAARKVKKVQTAGRLQGAL